MAWDIDIADVVAGQPIASSWGNLIRDRVVHVVASVAALPTDVANGSMAFVTADGSLHWRTGGIWARLGYREIRGRTPVTLAAGTDSVTQGINFPAGLFTVANDVVGLCTPTVGNVNVYAGIGTTGVATSQVRAVWRSAGQGPVSPLNITLVWMFWQL